MLSVKKSYREILKDELQWRIRRNAKYSLRAFSRDLGISSARLSEILSGKQGLSAASAKNVATLLHLKGEDLSIFCDLVESEHSRSPARRRLAQMRLELWRQQEANTLQMDQFRAISDWYHLAIFELVTLKHFRSDTAWIAKQLRISRDEAESAIERLIRLNLLERRSDGQIKSKSRFVASPDQIPATAIRKFHSQVMELARESLDKQSIDQRSVSSLMMAFNRRDFAKAAELIKEFRRTFEKTIDPTLSGEKDSVYCLGIQFFQIDAAEPSPLKSAPGEVA